MAKNATLIKEWALEYASREEAEKWLPSALENCRIAGYEIMTEPHFTARPAGKVVLSFEIRKAG